MKARKARENPQEYSTQQSQYQPQYQQQQYQAPNQPQYGIQSGGQPLS